MPRTSPVSRAGIATPTDTHGMTPVVISIAVAVVAAVVATRVRSQALDAEYREEVR